MRINYLVLMTLMLGFMPALAQAGSVLHKASHQSQLVFDASTTDNQNLGAENFISSVAKRGIDFLGDESMSESQRKAAFRKLLTSSFDINTIGRFAMGRYWRASSKSQRNEYLNLFKQMLVEVYSNRFGDYNGQVLKVVGSRSQGSSDVIVNSKVTGASQPEISVDWRVRYKNGKYKVVDIIVEGVSMALTHRSDFASVIQRGGGNVNVLLAHLRE